jgi:hypothetical protein
MHKRVGNVRTGFSGTNRAALADVHSTPTDGYNCTWSSPVSKGRSANRSRYIGTDLLFPRRLPCKGTCSYRNSHFDLSTFGVASSSCWCLKCIATLARMQSFLGSIVDNRHISFIYAKKGPHSSSQQRSPLRTMKRFFPGDGPPRPRRAMRHNADPVTVETQAVTTGTGAPIGQPSQRRRQSRENSLHYFTLNQSMATDCFFAFIGSGLTCRRHLGGCSHPYGSIQSWFGNELVPTHSCEPPPEGGTAQNVG